MSKKFYIEVEMEHCPEYQDGICVDTERDCCENDCPKIPFSPKKK